MPDQNAKRVRALTWAICLTLLLGTLAGYFPILSADFINLDDPEYVYEQPVVAQGLTWKGFLWSWQSSIGGNWNPFIWLSHMAGCQIFGTSPEGHHLVNLILHVSNVLLLFFVLKKMTGALWQSACAAAIFAWHPLHVESVAWISERKDVLSTLFWLLTLWAYTGFVQKLSAKNSRARMWYAVSLLFFVLGLMCKSMLVTLPFVLLLLDYWPLRRDKYFILKNAVLEKLPFYLLTVAGCSLAMWAQRQAGAIGDKCPLALRLENAISAGASYVDKFFWPVDLGIFYPYPGSFSVSQIVTAAILLSGITVSVIIWSRSHRYLAVGWCWFLGTLVPVIGLVQIGLQSMADRYTYVPYIGLAIMLSWGLAEMVQFWPSIRFAVNGVCIAGLAGLLAVTHLQTGYWKDSWTLFQHTVKVIPGSVLPYSNMGGMLMNERRLAEAEHYYVIVVRLMPESGLPYISLGTVYALENRLDDAIAAFTRAVQLDPWRAAAHYDLGNAYLLKGRKEEGIAQIQMALKLNPNHAKAQERMADFFMKQGKAVEALPYAEGFVHNDNEDARAHFILGQAYLMLHRPPEAIEQFKQSAALAPDSPASLNSLAWIYATNPKTEFRNGAEAVRMAEMADKLTKRQNLEIMDTLAAAYAEAGRFDLAVNVSRQIQARAEASRKSALAETAKTREALYRSGKPYRDDE